MLLSLDLLWGAACICAARFFHGRAHASVARVRNRMATPMKRRPPISRRLTTASASNTETLSLVAQLPPEAFARYEECRGAR